MPPIVCGGSKERQLDDSRECVENLLYWLVMALCNSSKREIFLACFGNVYNPRYGVISSCNELKAAVILHVWRMFASRFVCRSWARVWKQAIVGRVWRSFIGRLNCMGLPHDCGRP